MEELRREKLLMIACGGKNNTVKFGGASHPIHLFIPPGPLLMPGSDELKLSKSTHLPP